MKYQPLLERQIDLGNLGPIEFLAVTRLLGLWESFASDVAERAEIQQSTSNGEDVDKKCGDFAEFATAILNQYFVNSETFRKEIESEVGKVYADLLARQKVDMCLSERSKFDSISSALSKLIQGFDSNQDAANAAGIQASGISRYLKTGKGISIEAFERLSETRGVIWGVTRYSRPDDHEISNGPMVSTLSDLSVRDRRLIKLAGVLARKACSIEPVNFGEFITEIEQMREKVASELLPIIWGNAGNGKRTKQDFFNFDKNVEDFIRLIFHSGAGSSDLREKQRVALNSIGAGEGIKGECLPLSFDEVPLWVLDAPESPFAVEDSRFEKCVKVLYDQEINSEIKDCFNEWSHTFPKLSYFLQKRAKEKWATFFDVTNDFSSRMGVAVDTAVSYRFHTEIKAYANLAELKHSGEDAKFSEIVTKLQKALSEINSRMRQIHELLTDAEKSNSRQCSIEETNKMESLRNQFNSDDFIFHEELLRLLSLELPAVYLYDRKAYRRAFRESLLRRSHRRHEVEAGRESILKEHEEITRAVLEFCKGSSYGELIKLFGPLGFKLFHHLDTPAQSEPVPIHLDNAPRKNQLPPLTAAFAQQASCFEPSFQLEWLWESQKFSQLIFFSHYLLPAEFGSRVGPISPNLFMVRALLNIAMQPSVINKGIFVFISSKSQLDKLASSGDIPKIACEFDLDVRVSQFFESLRSSLLHTDWIDNSKLSAARKKKLKTDLDAFKKSPSLLQELIDSIFVIRGDVPKYLVPPCGTLAVFRAESLSDSVVTIRRSESSRVFVEQTDEHNAQDDNLYRVKQIICAALEMLDSEESTCNNEVRSHMKDNIRARLEACLDDRRNTAKV
jgi:hypothetical protein